MVHGFLLRALKREKSQMTAKQETGIPRMKTHAIQSRPHSCKPIHTDSAAHPVTTTLTGLLNNVTTAFYASLALALSGKK
jgi:hypothetical protein